MSEAAALSPDGSTASAHPRRPRWRQRWPAWNRGTFPMQRASAPAFSSIAFIRSRLPALFRPGRRQADCASGRRNEGAPAARHRSRPPPLREYGQRKREEGLTAMPLTRDFRETIRARTARDPDFREALLEEGGAAPACRRCRNRQIGAARLYQRDDRIRELGGLIDKSPKSLMRMLSPHGNPQARNLFEIIAHLQDCEGLRLTVRAER